MTLQRIDAERREERAHAERSASSVIELRIEVFELMASAVDSELSVDGALSAVAVVAPNGRFFAQELNCGETAIGKALPVE